MREKIKIYYHLTKPGIIYGNCLSLLAGFLLASDGNIDIILFFATIFGTGLIIASSCVVNNYIDREIDKKMKRTQKRAFVTGIISFKNGMIYASILGILGFGILITLTNWLVVLTGIIGMSFYLIFYSIEKRRSPLGTLVGTVPGAMPIVAGYVAVANQIDLAVIILFFTMVFWQLPHFFAIGVYRLNDYAEAGLPILPVKRGVKITKIHMIIYMILFLISSLMLTVFHYTGWVYFIVMFLLGLRWIQIGLGGFRTTDEVKWGKKVFGFSLLVLMTFSVLLALNVVLP